MSGSAVVELVVGVVVDGEAHAWRGLQEENVCVVVPAVFVSLGREAVRTLVDQLGAKFGQEAWVVQWVPMRLEHPGPPLSQTTTSSVSG